MSFASPLVISGLYYTRSAKKEKQTNSVKNHTMGVKTWKDEIDQNKNKTRKNRKF